MTSKELLQPEPKFLEESALVGQVLGIDDTASLHPDDQVEFDMLVEITAQFSRTDETGTKQTISRDRIGAIPAITQRYVGLVKNARGQLSYQDIMDAWFGNMPENDGTRHPDLLFDIAQFNFGTDEPIGDIVRAFTLAALQRKAMRNIIKSNMTRMATSYRNQRTAADTTEDEQIDAFLDRLEGQP